MNKAITDGIVFMPPAFENGLGVWSAGDGTPGSPTYDGSGTGAFVPSDADFGGCLEILKINSPQQLRYMGQPRSCRGAICRSRRGSRRSVALCQKCGSPPGPVQQATPTVNGDQLRCEHDEEGRCIAVNPCRATEPTAYSDDCLAPAPERAWSSPIFVDFAAGSAVQ